MNSNTTFTRYSLNELLVMRQTVDREKYPEKAMEIDLAISEKQTNLSELQKINIENALNQTLKKSRKYKTFIPRLLSSSVDIILLGVLSSIISYLTVKMGSEVQTWIGKIQLFEAVLYSIILHSLYGQTLGKMLLKVKVVNFPDESEISIKQAIIRDIVPLTSAVLFFLLLLFIPFTNGETLPPWIIVSMAIFSFSYFLWHLLEIITMLFNSKNRALHDFISGTIVIRQD